jgi:mono/diheme cytochrome c family protein
MDLLTLSRNTHAPILALSIGLALAGCGGGGSPGDARPGPQPVAPVSGEPDRFLLFPNPQLQADGGFQTDTQEYAEAYYRAIDPSNERDTLAKFKAKNGFETGTGTEVLVVFGDRRDLGYGRRMHARQNADGTLAFYVENYQVQAGEVYEYSPVNLEAAIARDPRWLIAVSAIEYSPGPQGGASFVKFYNFDPAGVRRLAVDLDGRGPKAMPGVCTTCHGGRGDALTPPDSTGHRRFALAHNLPSPARGDTQSRLQPFEPDTFDFSSVPGFTRGEQEASFKTLNRMVLCSYPLAAASSSPEDACRRPAGPSEWQGAQAELIKSGYGGEGLPNATFSDRYIPASWERAGQSALYREVVATSCRTCHSLLGTRAQSDLDFTTYEKFAGFSERIKVHAFDRGNMPLAKIVYDEFWEHASRPTLLASFVESHGHAVRDAGGNLHRPGRPVADPGPDRVARPGAIRLSGELSLFASGYAWSLVSGPAGASLQSADSKVAFLNASAAGTYVVQLVVSNDAAQSAPAQLRVTVDPALPNVPAEIRFADVKAVLQGPAFCAACHSSTGPQPRPPILYTNDDRNGDGTAGDATDDRWFYEEVRSRVNFTDVAASPLLRKPSGSHHFGGRGPGFDASRPPGDAARARYDLVLNWILNGAPY